MTGLISSLGARLATGAMLAALGMGAALADTTTVQIGGREAIVFSPSHPPASGARALVIVLHGGLGNASRIHEGTAESGLNLDAVAEVGGFYVAYLNGTQVAARLPAKFEGWNAGDCCGLPASSGVDDVAYIQSAVAALEASEGIDPKRVYGIGHSNGAMMVQRLICESPVLASGIAISGGLELETAKCPAASGKQVMAIHGAEDANVPVAGGKGKGLADVAFHSEAQTQQVFTASGASYRLDLVEGADHFLTNIDAAVQKRDGVSIAQKAVAFFGLAGAAR